MADIIGTSLISLTLWILLGYAYPELIRYLCTKKMLCRNYMGVEIPVAVGIVIPFSMVVVSPMVFMGEGWEIFVVQAVALFLMAYVGWKDDQQDGASVKGLKGHLVYLLTEKKISTGLWKAIIASLLAMMISAFYSSSLPLFFLHFLLIVLLTNFINLLDLRPGRALKGFFLLFIVIAVFSFQAFPALLWLPVAVTAAFLLRMDLRGLSMLGDTGANCLGMALGIWAVVYVPLELKWILGGFTLLVHLYTERKSLTVLIQKTAILHWLDMLGRKEV